MIALQIIAGFATLLSIILMAKEKVGAWLWGMIGLIAFFFIHVEQKLYLQAVIQAVFFGQAIYGLWNWSKKRPEPLRPKWNKINKTLSYFGGVLVGSWIISMFYGSFTDASSPFIDTWTTGLSMLGNLWLAQKKIEGWLVWALVNFMLFFVFFANKFYISSTMEIIFFSISISNIMQWRRRN